MFKRKNKQKWTESFRNFLWPKLGLKRWMQYNSHRVGRLSDSPYKIASGLACGVAVSFTPFIGLHVVLAIICSYIIRGNLFAAVVGTIIGNPWTFPFIWTLTYNIGAKFTGVEDPRSFSDLIDGEKLISHPFDALEPVFYPMIHGGLISGLLVGWLSYFVFVKLIVTYRKKREARLEKRKLKLRRRYEERMKDLAEKRSSDE